MGEHDTSGEGADWENARNLIDSLGDTLDGRRLSREKQPDTIIETEIRKAGQAATRISAMVFHPDSSLGAALGRLQASGEVNFSLEPVLVDGSPSEGGAVSPALTGSEDEQEHAATKIGSFLARHEVLISLMRPSLENVPKAKKLEDEGQLPQGWAKRIKATAFLSNRIAAERAGQVQRAAITRAALDKLQAEGIEPLSEAEIAARLDVAIKLDGLEGRFD